MDEILSDEVVGVSYDKRPFFHSSATIWIGSWDGLARALDPNGKTGRYIAPNMMQVKFTLTPIHFLPMSITNLGGAGYVHIHADVKVSFLSKWMLQFCYGTGLS
ncbi:MAG: hypothetical protein Ct9H300mP29_0280 [Candidatus Neomarinimicrobiota bacterium]|nr:MAG: hypothetical protein Ct9H300mP29_0280 [Candidatus Neomarinimicrobiota bacterium]